MYTSEHLRICIPCYLNKMFCSKLSSTVPLKFCEHHTNLTPVLYYFIGLKLKKLKICHNKNVSNTQWGGGERAHNGGGGKGRKSVSSQPGAKNPSYASVNIIDRYSFSAVFVLFLA